MDEWRTPLKGQGRHYRKRQLVAEGVPLEPRRRRQTEESYDVKRRPTISEAVRAIALTGSASNAGKLRKAESAELDRRREGRSSHDHI